MENEIKITFDPDGRTKINMEGVKKATKGDVVEVLAASSRSIVDRMTDDEDVHRYLLQMFIGEFLEPEFDDDDDDDENED